MDAKQAVTLAKSGAEEGYRWIFEQVYPRLARYLQTAFRLSEVEVSDLTQETFVKGFRCIDQLKDSDRILPWMLAIGRNQALIMLQQTRREEQMTDSFLFEYSTFFYQDACEREQLSQLVSEVIARLPGGEIKETVSAYYQEGSQTVDQLAKRFGTSRGTITARLKRFRDAVKVPLARKLSELGYSNLERFS